MKPGARLDHTMRRAAGLLRAAGSPTPELDAGMLIADVLTIRRPDWLLQAERVLSDHEAAAIAAMVARRQAREPVAQIIRRREFWDHSFQVERAVLTPRPDSETVIEAALALVDDDMAAYSLLDLGIGSGCLLFTLLHALPNARGVGVDISLAALRVAKHNMQGLGLDHRAALVQADWTAPLAAGFDVIVANPPYIPSAEIATLEPEVARFEPRLALDGGPDGFAGFRRIVPALQGILHPAGIVIFECGVGQAERLSGLLRSHGFADVRPWTDLRGIDRCVSARRNTEN